jgi:beta-glucanase (GH16 family)
MLKLLFIKKWLFITLTVHFFNKDVNAQNLTESANATYDNVTTTNGVAAVPLLLWSDEFESTSINSGVWTPRIGNNNGWGNGELQYYSEQNVAILNQQYLSITVLRETDSNGTVTFTSARIDTKDKVHVMYGTISASIKIPDVDAGLWPAFWTLGAADLEFPAMGEMDIMEAGEGAAISQGKANHRIISGAHWENNGTYTTLAGSRDFDFDLNGTFFVYTLDWTPTNITTYVNDDQVWTMDITPEGGCLDCEEFHQPHYIVLNVAVGGGFTTSGGSSGSSSSSSSSGCGSSGSSGACGSLRTPADITAPLPATMLVDWVRIFNNGGSVVNVTTSQTASPSLSAEVESPVAAAPLVAPFVAPSVNIVAPATAPSASILGSSAGKSGKSGKGSGKGSGKSSRKGNSGKSGKVTDDKSALEYALSAAPRSTSSLLTAVATAACLAIAQLM